MLDCLYLHFERLRLFRGQNTLTVAEVVIRHGEDGFICKHLLCGVKKPVNRLAGWKWPPFMVLYMKTPPVVPLGGVVRVLDIAISIAKFEIGSYNS